MIQNQIFKRQANDSKSNIWQTDRIEHLRDRQIIQNRISDKQTDNSKSNLWQTDK